eukprot:TRINITY_DN14889_c0_g1_i1.p1 TRINITY_DN14889_c0_g1~~TRINITY_DN14889_c0_g1_i1.p1  ORF type:complete len:205 (-),score=14.27 TRINITY_DN14889_c0_g1_i1:44-658(-)
MKANKKKNKQNKNKNQNKNPSSHEENTGAVDLSSGECWQGLGNELLHMLFSSLDVVSLLRAGATCRRWHAASALTILWEHHAQQHAADMLRFTDIEQLRITPNGFFNVLKAKAKKMKSLRDITVQRDVEVNKNLPTIQILMVGDWGVGRTSCMKRFGGNLDFDTFVPTLGGACEPYFLTCTIARKLHMVQINEFNSGEDLVSMS